MAPRHGLATASATMQKLRPMEVHAEAATMTRPPNDRGQGRKPISPTGERMKSRQVRMTDAQWEHCKSIGGGAWLRYRVEADMGVIVSDDAYFLNWMADRLVFVYKESPNVDFVLAVRRIAANLRAKEPT